MFSEEQSDKSVDGGQPLLRKRVKSRDSRHTFRLHLLRFFYKILSKTWVAKCVYVCKFQVKNINAQAQDHLLLRRCEYWSSSFILLLLRFSSAAFSHFQHAWPNSPNDFERLWTEKRSEEKTQRAKATTVNCSITVYEHVWSIWSHLVVQCTLTAYTHIMFVCSFLPFLIRSRWSWPVKLGERTQTVMNHWSIDGM